MKRRNFLKMTTGAGAALGFLGGPSAVLAAEDNEPCKPAPFPEVQKLTEYVAQFVVETKHTDVPADVVELSKKSILDGLGLALSGSRGETAPLVEQYLKSFTSPQVVSVMGTSAKAPTRFAAFANGVAIHVDDFDDTQLAMAKDRVYGLLVHPTVCVLPAALAIAELNQRSGRDFLLSYNLGVDVECKIAEAISPRHYEDGFHSTGTCGVFGSTAACARLRGFDVGRTVRAFAIAASHAAGLRENFGTMMKPFQAGHSAESGVAATDFAALGWTGAEDILEAQRGFFQIGRAHV